VSASPPARPFRLRPIHIYCGAVFAIGLTVVIALLRSGSSLPQESSATRFWLFVAVVILGELLPVTLPRQASEAVITTSTTFGFAVLFSFGTTPAVIVYAVASAVADIAARRAIYLVLFNAGQYALSMAACGLLLDASIGLGDGMSDFSVGNLAWIAVGSVAFFVINAGSTLVASALRNAVPLRLLLQEDVGFNAGITGMLIAIAPVVVLIADHAPALMVVVLAPIVVAYRMAKVSVEKQHQSLHDALTGLANRNLFFQYVREALAESRSRSVPAAVMIVDLDHFKEVNDTLGHHVGDLLLTEASSRLAAVLGGNGAIARMGGDEFGLLLRSVLNRAEVEAVAAEVVDAIEQPFMIAESRLTVGASIGSVMYPEHGDDADTLVKRAEIAMYVAKAGHNDHVVYTDALDQHSPERLALVSELRQAIHDRELQLHFQPKVAIATREVLGLEALARWIHPERGFVPPDEFIPLAERTGLIRPLTTLVIEEALRRCRDLRDSGNELSIAVNLSARVVQDAKFPDEVAELLEQSGVEPALLHLELTESMVMVDRIRSMEVLDRLHAMGLSLSIDDFGTGYSSLAYLKRLPVDEIKIDKSFILNMAVDSNDALIARSTVDLGHNLGLQVVAEGVETPEIWERLEAMGCDQAQGYLISRPLPFDDFVRWLHGWERRRHEARAVGLQ
jgi:diguanylate cyclase (GGDEF)-like protein